jgi:glycosyltransferase involved in cell wall biosynthesis
MKPNARNGAVANRANRPPSVSVLMAVHNGQRYLAESLDTVLAQTWKDFELIVVDDGSTDETPSILRAYAQRDPRFVLLRNDSNLKLPASLNRGLTVCRAPLVARADADDLNSPSRLEEQIKFLEQHPLVGAVSCCCLLVDADRRVLRRHAVPTEDPKIKFKLLWESTLAHSGVSYRVGLVRSVGGYDETYTTAQDYDLWARLANRTEFANLAGTFLTVRFGHATSSSTIHGSETAEFSRSVSHRLVSRYLGRSLERNDAGALQALLCAYESVAAGDLLPALNLLDELVALARCRESADTWNWARHEIGRSLLKQARYHTYNDPANSWELLRRAAGVDARSVCSRSGILQILRLLLRGVHRLHRAAKFPDAQKDRARQLL